MPKPEKKYYDVVARKLPTCCRRVAATDEAISGFSDYYWDYLSMDDSLSMMS
jgi:hypothetical protein